MSCVPQGHGQALCSLMHLTYNILINNAAFKKKLKRILIQSSNTYTLSLWIMHTHKTKSGGRSCISKRRGSDKATITISQPCALLLSHLKAGQGQENLSVGALHMCQEIQSIWWERRQKNLEHRENRWHLHILELQCKLAKLKRILFSFWKKWDTISRCQATISKLQKNNKTKTCSPGTGKLFGFNT